MDDASQTGIFVGYTNTMKNVYVISDKTNTPQTITHKNYDEAHMNSYSNPLPPVALPLQRAGYNNIHTNGKETTIPPESSHLKVKLLSTHTKSPTRATPTSACLDLYYPSEVAIEPHSTALIATYIVIDHMDGTYAQIATYSNFAQKGASTLGGVIDPDYRSNITTIMHKSSFESIYIE